MSDADRVPTAREVRRWRRPNAKDDELVVKLGQKWWRRRLWLVGEDAAPAIQKLVDEAMTFGGGIVHLPLGHLIIGEAVCAPPSSRRTIKLVGSSSAATVLHRAPHKDGNRDAGGTDE